ncbi:PPE family protein [Lentzea atacamensis]|uniref:PPE family protein n=2 Tax=Lentzea TaxID=165301 RepID=A0A316IDB1_9PSEU|nr:PPE domain-containing protein [Lentzea atacamensis]PWK90883.1 PPE family protein [Lentzea atacamensis]RAS58906.1 PPE family protein [Lentzea atacamensis]
MSQGSHDNKGNGNSGKDDKSPYDDQNHREKLYEPIDWMTFSHVDLYNMVHTGVNLAGAQAAATNWQKIAEDISGVRTNLLKAVEDSAVGWDSESARLARDGLTQVTNWVDDTAHYAQKVSAAITTETNNVEAARAAMPPPPKAPEPPVPVEPQIPRSALRDRLTMIDGVSGFGGIEDLRRDARLVQTTGEFSGFENLGTSTVDTLAAADASHRVAADVMAAFQRNSAAVDQTVPAQFTPPVNPVNPNPTLGGPDTGTRTPPPDTSTGGGAGGPVTTTPGSTNRGTTNTSSRSYGGGAGVRGGGGGFGGGMAGRTFVPGSGNQAGGGGGAGGSGGAGLAAGVNERSGAGAAAAAASSATGGQTRAFQNPLAMGAAPMAGAPAAAQGRDDEREHKSASYLEEDDNVFGLDRKAAPPVIGQ